MRSARLAIVLAGAALALTACGEDGSPSSQPTPFAGDTAEQVLTKARTAAKSASSVRMKGSFAEDKETMKVDMVLSDAKGANGTITSGDQTMQVRQVGQIVYIKGGPFATQAGGKYANKWIKSKAGSGGAAGLGDLSSMDKTFSSMLEPDGTLKRVAGKDVSGTPTVGLQDPGTDKNAATLYIAAKGEPYPLLIEPKSGPGSFTFSDWNKPVTVEAPPADEVVDAAKLGG